ncbi:hypothetical protein FE391_46305 [Nonomuraea sp. KC401]|uniref:hypothetical protein n=1 Tax=unclassified Nonomuraea TaxID=2593643 RepID=UPI0010FD0A38|nr:MULTISPECIES: hypothetical protein [unclassified Nonomuraea]NBE98130.1 hypothetical protein [Nonomuraea sp. K271]TLF47316.1 hypothetical protein FE391_46305 [Nonomuraea sp. KC401]
MRPGHAACLVAFLLGFPGPGFLFLQLTTEVGEFVLLFTDLLFQFCDAGGRGGVPFGEFGGSLAGGVPVVLGLTLPVGGLGGELLSLGACVLVLTDLSPGVLLAFLGTVAGGLGLGAGRSAAAIRVAAVLAALVARCSAAAAAARASSAACSAASTWASCPVSNKLA